MLLSRHVLMVLASVVGLLPSLVRGMADEPKGRTPEAPAAQGQKELSPEQIGALVEQLDAPRFAERQAASEKLAAMGRPAIPALGKAAVGESLEATIRSIDILRKLLDSSDGPTQEAAKAALETIAKSDRPAAARRAEDVLNSRRSPVQFPGGMPNAMFQGGAIQLGFGAGAGRRVSVKNVNGVKDIEIDENQRKIKIHDDPQQGIKIEVTTKKDGKETAQKYEAKNAEELKKKHPEGYKFYKEYAENPPGGMFQIQVQANAFGGPVPLPVPAVPGIAPAPAPGIPAEHSVRIALLRLKSLSRQLESLAKDDQWKKAPAQSKEELKKQLAELKQQVTDLEKRLQEAPPAASQTEKPPAKPEAKSNQ